MLESMNNRLTVIPLAAVFALVFMAERGFALDGCHEYTKTPYERLYCDIKAKGGGQGLPRLEEFRRNSTTVQALLLKRPAKRLGLPVPRHKSAKKKQARKKLAKQKGSERKSIKKKVVKRNIREKKKTFATSQARSLSQCKLLGESIRCGRRMYQLTDNKTNKFLAKGALSSENHLGLNPFRGDPNNTQAVKQYLSKSYRRYIEKMLAIGLGASTMSFSKFYYTYQEVVKKGESFSARFETMYDYLKRDKAGMAVKARYSKQLPANLSQCSDLSANLIVCDNSSTNWIFVRQ